MSGAYSAWVLIASLLLITVQGQQDEFQLVTKEGLCLQVTKNTGIINRCKDPEGNLTLNTVYYLSGAPGTYSLHIAGALGLCLDREHCHSGSSDLRYSECDHCGAIHWNIVTSNGEVCEDACKNCIYKNLNSTAAIHHCSNGFEPFNKTMIGTHTKGQHLLKTYYEHMHTMYKEAQKNKKVWEMKKLWE